MEYKIFNRQRPKNIKRWVDRINAKIFKMSKSISRGALKISLDEMEEIIQDLCCQIDHEETIEKLLTLRKTDGEGILFLYARLEFYKDVISALQVENKKLKISLEKKEQFIKKIIKK